MAKIIKLFSTSPNDGKEVDKRIDDFLEANPDHKLQALWPVVCDRIGYQENCLLVEFKTSD